MCSTCVGHSHRAESAAAIKVQSGFLFVCLFVFFADLKNNTNKHTNQNRKGKETEERMERKTPPSPPPPKKKRKKKEEEEQEREE